jgi:putative transcriptional regulator
MAKEKANPIWDEVIADLTELAETLEAGGMKAIAKKFRVTTGDEVLQRARRIPAVQSIREKLKIDQSAFAALLGVSVQTLQAWERGTQNPARTSRRFLEEIDRDPRYWRRRVVEMKSLPA